MPGGVTPSVKLRRTQTMNLEIDNLSLEKDLLPSVAQAARA